jgi:hypothetical protein
LPRQRNAGISLCAGELLLPSEKTSETVPTRPIGLDGLVDLGFVGNAPFVEL